MTNLSASGRLAAFTFHAYPGGSGTPPHTLPELNLNSTWLRTGIMTGSYADRCLGWWRELVDGGSSLGIAVTESSSSWNASLPPPAQDTFVNGFFSLAEWGQYASTGAQFIVRYESCGVAMSWIRTAVCLAAFLLSTGPLGIH